MSPASQNDGPEPKVRAFRIGEEEADQRLDRWLKKTFPHVPFGQLAKLMRTGQVRIDGKRAKPNSRLAPGQEVRLPPQLDPAVTRPAESGGEPVVSEADARLLAERVLYRDERLIAIDKPAGLAVQGGPRTRRHLDAMLPALSFDRPEPPRLVHRLDKDTSGVLLLARDAATARALTRAFRDKTTEKIYWALVAGLPEPAEGRIDLPIAKQPGGEGERMAVDESAGQGAETLYRVLARSGEGSAAWLELRPITGRTHQLRVHLAAIGHPILGDGKYGGRAAHALSGVPGRLMLHAREIALADPLDGTTLRVDAAPPGHFEQALAALRFDIEAVRRDS